MEDPVFKQKYQKCKLRVKLWEKDFKKKNGRIPSKYDIREAPQEIRDSYKMYYKLKTSFLEDTLNDVLSDDGFDVLEMSQKEGDLDISATESINGGPQLPLDITKLIEQQQRDIVAGTQENINHSSTELELPESSVLTNLTNNAVLREFEPVEQLALNDKAWGPTVTKKPEEKEVKKITRKSLKPNFKEKLFENTSFSKRNPRKSLTKSALDNSMRGSQTNLNESSNAIKEVLPDLETILLQKAKEQQTAAGIAVNPLLTIEKSKENIKTQVDEGWLERNAAQNGIKNRVTLDKKIQKMEGNDSQISSKKKSVYGLSNLDVSKFLSHSVEAQSLINFTINDQKENTESKTLEPIKLCENPVEHTIPQKKSFKFEDSNSDSVVDDSEEEKESQEYRHIVKRRRVINSTPPQNEEENIKIARSKKKLELDTLDRKLIGKNDLEKDFSPDPKEDKDYADEKSKAKRKAAAVRRKTTTVKPKSLTKEKKSQSSAIVKRTRASTRKKNDEKPNKELSEQPVDIKHPTNSDNSNSVTQKKTRNTRASARRTKELKYNEDDTLPEQPLNPEDIKYTLALERGGITSVPRLKLTDLDKADVLAQEYINTLAPLPTNVKSLKPIPVTEAEVKRAAAKRKLEEKIASGKLNENFVTINIQKKVFARGKKTVNYSKYKKKLWKHKKHIAALTGPDMDMGGCDGGTLKCFNCGQAGHFAQSCTVKGDSLLPLTAQLAEDTSPFPTLEEAERMASQTAVAAHSRNIAKLPQAANAALYKMDEENSDAEMVDNESDEVTVTSCDNDRKTQEDTDEIPMETDDELEGFDINTATIKSQKELSPIKKYVGSKIPVEFLKAAGIDPNNSNSNTFSQFRSVGPLYDLQPDGTVKEVTPEVLDALKMFGHTNFRKGQDRAVMRILSGMSTLVTLSTGSGKSLCYQLPAYLYSKHKKSITLVISPLVSLMEDQVTGIPHFLRAHCLHTNQTPQQKLKILKMIADGEIDVLLVSPEAVVAGERSTGFGSILRQLPPIAFACIDEAHCVSQWSHNFRPSYLMICKVLKQNLGVKCVLGLTATATVPTRLSIINHLDITDGEKGVISDIPLPDNLILSVSKDENRDAALLQLLQSKRFEACHSIIVYCTRRDECERIASYLRTCLQDRKIPEIENAKRKRKRVNWHAEPYHAGMPASRRRTIQNAFMCNELRIVVATIAFGMGINKPDIRAVIHYNMPRNFESYVQEIGRAGRDNKISHCHLFLDANAGDKNELKRHIYANSLDRHVFRKLLQRIFVPCSCDKNLKDGDLKTPVTKNNDASEPRQHICPGHEIGFSIEKTVEVLDIPEENISTLLCYMELDTRWCINVLSNAYIKAKVISYGGPKYLKYAAKECPPLAMAIAMEIKNGSFKEDANIIEFSVIDVAAAIGWNSGVVKYQLKNLEWVQVNGYPKRSSITVSFYDLGFRIKAPGDFTTDEIDDALDTLYSRALKQEQTQLIQLQYVFQGLSSVAYNTYGPCCTGSLSHDRSDQLKGIIRDYFRNDYPKDLKLEIDHSNTSDSDLESDIIGLINMYPENSFSGRNIAKIFHGIASPNYPAQIWYRCKFWRVHSKIDFNRIVHLANNVIVKRRT
ncbi:hypothetical protein DOY81_002087 [Sarcophaga bullata]|nr:hypothetical protein DOY81_002087 [Sarcophaga bullata]